MTHPVKPGGVRNAAINEFDGTITELRLAALALAH
jgi:hypothetical protein